MKLIINGKNKEFSNSYTLHEIIAQCSANAEHVIAEINGSIIKSHQWQTTNIADGDAIELVTFVGGG